MQHRNAPLTPNGRRRLVALEAVVNELKSEVGPACRKALEEGNPYIPLDARKISKCSQDVGSAP